MDFLGKIWSWTKGNFDWIVIGANALVVMGVIYYTLQTGSIATKFEIQNQQLIQQNKSLLDDNKNLKGVLNSAGQHFNKQNELIQKQQIIMKMQEEGIDKLLQRIKQLERLLNDDFIAAS